MRGIVSALSLSLPSPESGEGLLAAGTWTRWVGLYDMAGLGGLVSTWSVAEAADAAAGVGGTGVTQTAWSACGGIYLCVVERKSRGVLVYDVRVMGKLVSWLEGREADTNQRLGVDVFEAEAGMEIWAGGTDGVVRVWEGVGKTEGGVERSWEWRAHDGTFKSASKVLVRYIDSLQIPSFRQLSIALALLWQPVLGKDLLQSLTTVMGAAKVVGTARMKPTEVVMKTNRPLTPLNRQAEYQIIASGIINYDIILAIGKVCDLLN